MPPEVLLAVRDGALPASGLLPPQGDVDDGLGPALQPCCLLKRKPLPVPESTVEIEKRRQEVARKKKGELKAQEAGAETPSESGDMSPITS